MTLTAFCIALLIAGAGDAVNGGPPPVSVHMWAVQATQEDRAQPHFDREVVAIKPAVEELPYDTYKKVAVAWRSAQVNEPARLPIDGTYTLIATPLPDQGDHRIRLEVAVEMKNQRDARGGAVKALQTTMALVPEKMVKLRGFRLDTGNELLIVLSVER